MRKRLLLLPCIAIVSALALTACGGSESEEDRVEEVIVSSATNTDPARCTELNTQAFMEQLSQEDGKAAVEGCEQEAEGDEGAESVEVSKIKIRGTNATASVAVVGTGLDGQSLEVAVVKDGDDWKVDEFVRLAKFDRDALVENFEREIAGSGEINQALAACFVEAFEESSQAEIEKMLLGGSPKGFEEVAEACN